LKEKADTVINAGSYEVQIR